MGIDITNVKIRPIKSTAHPDLIAVASIVIDNELAINDIRVYKHPDDSYKIKLPNHPISAKHNVRNVEALTYESWQKIKNIVVEQTKMLCLKEE